MRRGAARLGAATLFASASLAGASAQDAVTVTVRVSLKSHRFEPAEPGAPPGRPIVLIVGNQDASPAEFESKTLHVDRVIGGGSSATFRVRALTPGRYRFSDLYRGDATEGFLIVK